MSMVVLRRCLALLLTPAAAWSWLSLACVPLPGTSPRNRPPIDAAAAESPEDLKPASDATASEERGPRDVVGSTDAPRSCEGDDPVCCQVFGFEGGTNDGFAVPACCADAFSQPETLPLAGLGEGGCGKRALRVQGLFALASAAACDVEPFGFACASQIGELSAPLPGTFDLRGKQLRGRVWLPEDVTVEGFRPEVRAFAVGPSAVVYGTRFALGASGWQSFESSFANAQDPPLATVSRWGVQLSLRPTSIPNHQWSGPIWFDALGWISPVTAAP